MMDLKKGTTDQFLKLLVIQSKSIYFSLHIQQLINKSIKSVVAILTNNNGEPYLENSCCDDGTINTIEYFKEKEPDIDILNTHVVNLNFILQDIGILTRAKNIVFIQIIQNQFTLHYLLKYQKIQYIKRLLYIVGSILLSLLMMN